MLRETRSKGGGPNGLNRRGAQGRLSVNGLLKFIEINACSLRNKKNDLRDLAQAKDLKLISVTETWCKDWMSDGSLSLDGYTMYRCDRKEANGGAKGGGTILYVRNDIEQRSCKALNTGDYDSSVWCWIMLKGGKKVLVGSIYRSPNSSRENNERLLQKMKCTIWRATIDLCC